MTLLARWVAAARRDRHAVIALAATIFFYGFFIPYFDKPGGKTRLDNPNEIARVYGVVAMVEHHHLYVNDVMKRWPTRTTDMAVRKSGPKDPVGAPDELMYPGKSPGTVLFVVPFYAAYRALTSGHETTAYEATYVCRLFGSILPSIALSFAFYLFLRRLTPSRYLALGFYLVYVTGTMALPYSLIFASHQLASASLIVAFALVAARGHPRPWGRAALAGFLLGLAISSEYSAIFGAGLVGLYALVRGTDQGRAAPGEGWRAWLARRRHLLGALGGLSIPAAATAWYHWAAFGSPLSTPYQHLSDPTFRDQWKQGFHGFIAPQPRAILGVLVSRNDGLLALSPILILAGLAIYRVVRSKRGRLEVGLALSLFVILLAYVSAVPFWRGGWTVGPRYVANVVPPLVALALYGIPVVTGDLRRSLLGGLGIVSLTFMAPTALFPHIPDTLPNPIYEALVPLARGCLVPDNALGVRSGTALVLYAAAMLAVAGYLLFGGPGSRTLKLKAAATSLAVVLIVHGALARAPRMKARSREFVTLVRDMWPTEPKACGPWFVPVAPSPDPPPEPAGGKPNP